MEIVDAYVHADFGEIGKLEFGALAKELEARVIYTVKPLTARFDAQPELYYYLEQASLRTRTLVQISTILSILSAVSTYHNLRLSVMELYEDSRQASTAIIEEFKKLTNVGDKKIIYRRSVSKDINRLHRIISNVDDLSSVHTQTEALNLRDNLLSDIAGLHQDHPNDPGIERLLEIIPKRQIPAIPKRIDDVVNVVRRRRDLFPRPRPPTEPVRERGRRTRRLRYERTVRL